MNYENYWENMDNFIFPKLSDLIYDYNDKLQIICNLYHMKRDFSLTAISHWHNNAAFYTLQLFYS